jgi:hypothetical protein
VEYIDLAVCERTSPMQIDRALLIHSANHNYLGEPGGSG